MAKLTAILNHNRFVLALSFVLAILIWFVVSIAYSPQTDRNIAQVPIEISFSDSESGYKAYTKTELLATVEVTGKKYVVEQLGVDSLVVSATADAVTGTGNYTLNVQARKRTGGGDYTVVSVTPSTINVMVDVERTAQFDVRIDCVGATVEELSSENENMLLEKMAESVSKKYGVGIYIVTVEDYRDFHSEGVYKATYTIYHECTMGEGPNHDGIMLLLSMDDRDWAMFCYGSRCEYAFNSYGQQKLEKVFLDNFGENDWYGGFEDYVKECSVYLEKASVGKPVRASLFYPLLIVIGLSLLAAAAVVAVIWQKMDTVSKKATANDYVSAMKSVQSLLGQVAKESPKAERALALIGLTMDDLKGKGAQEALQTIMRALSGISDEEARLTAANVLLGESGANVAQIAMLTSDELAELNKGFEQNGYLSDEQVAKAAEVADAFTEVKQTYKAVVAEIGAALAPALKSIAQIAKSLAPIVTALANAFAGLGQTGQLAALGALAALATLPSLIVGIAMLKKSLDVLCTNPVMAAVAGVVALTAIGIGAAMLSGLASSASANTYAAPTSTTSYVDSGETNITINATTNASAEDIADEVAEALVNKKKERGYV